MDTETRAVAAGPARARSRATAAVVTGVLAVALLVVGTFLATRGGGNEPKPIGDGPDSGSAAGSATGSAIGSAIGTETGTEAGTEAGTETGKVTTELAYDWSDTPAPVVLLLPDRRVGLDAWTTCWSGPPDDQGVTASMCADGAPAVLEELPVVRCSRRVDFWFGMPGWTFEASVGDGTHEPGAERSAVPVKRTGPQRFRVDFTGMHGEQVDLFGTGPQGDVAMSFAWQPTAAANC